MNTPRARSLAHYSRAARRRKLALLIPALALAIATGVALRKPPNLYESTASMAITPVKTEAVTDATRKSEDGNDRRGEPECLSQS